MACPYTQIPLRQTSIRTWIPGRVPRDVAEQWTPREHSVESRDEVTRPRGGSRWEKLKRKELVAAVDARLYLVDERVRGGEGGVRPGRVTVTG